ncbi:MAG: hypothetical protein P1V51_19570 [Deltaproteobacteria bacterium]|nr:hypothetical protein [Deltaproteobacteria bacterium]
MMRSILLFGSAVAVLALSLCARPAEACSPVLFTDFGVSVSDPTPQADLPPLTIDDWSISRGCGKNGGSGNCKDLGYLELQVGPTAALNADLGVNFEVSAGDAPMALTEVVSAQEAGRVTFTWGDGTGQPPLDFTIRIQAVDRQGRVGAWSEPTRITHEGGSPCVLGCASTGLAGGGVTVALCLVGGLLLRRRRSGGSSRA